MNQNAMQVLDIYRHANCWVFDAPEYELCKEPFVLGSSEIISSHLPRGTVRAKLVFSDEYFPMATGLDREMEDGGGFWYGRDGVSGWLCPATLHYFEEFPETIYFRAEPTQVGNHTQYEYLMEDILMLLESGTSHWTLSMSQHRHRPSASSLTLLSESWKQSKTSMR